MTSTPEQRAEADEEAISNLRQWRTLLVSNGEPEIILAELDARAERIKELEAQVHELESILHGKPGSELATLQARVAELEAEKAKLLATQAERIKELESTIALGLGSIKNAHQHGERLEARVATLEADKGAAHQAIVESDKRVVKLEAALRQARSAIATALMAQEDHERYPGSPEERTVKETYVSISKALGETGGCKHEISTVIIANSPTTTTRDAKCGKCGALFKLAAWED